MEIICPFCKVKVKVNAPSGALKCPVCSKNIVISTPVDCEELPHRVEDNEIASSGPLKPIVILIVIIIAIILMIKSSNDTKKQPESSPPGHSEIPGTGSGNSGTGSGKDGGGAGKGGSENNDNPNGGEKIKQDTGETKDGNGNSEGGNGTADKPKENNSTIKENGDGEPDKKTDDNTTSSSDEPKKERVKTNFTVDEKEIWGVATTSVRKLCLEPQKVVFPQLGVEGTSIQAIGDKEFNVFGYYKAPNIKGKIIRTDFKCKVAWTDNGFVPEMTTLSE